MKTFTLQYFGSCINPSYLNRWLEIAITPGIEEVVLSVPTYNNYNFPCSFLFNGSEENGGILSAIVFVDC